MRKRDDDQPGERSNELLEINTGGNAIINLLQLKIEELEAQVEAGDEDKAEDSICDRFSSPPAKKSVPSSQLIRHTSSYRLMYGEYDPKRIYTRSAHQGIFHLGVLSGSFAKHLSRISVWERSS